MEMSLTVVDLLLERKLSWSPNINASGASIGRRFRRYSLSIQSAYSLGFLACSNTRPAFFLAIKVFFCDSDLVLAPNTRPAHKSLYDPHWFGL